MDKFKKTIQKIEKQEKSWRYILTEEEETKHSFGRVPEDDREVAFWSIPRSTGEFLEFMAKFTKSKIILELGCSVGYSTLFLAKAAKENKGHVFTTEILDKKIDMAKKNFSESGLSNVITLLEKEIIDVLKKWNKNEKIDLVFVDADKENYSLYLKYLIPLLSKRGLIMVDNAGKVRMANGDLIDSEHINKFVKKVKNNKKLNNAFINMDNGLLLINKK
ncbi:class I SAM-dependent methyltransferase [Candidatus Parcubacteria bacterium]|nr:class I SAM-dependent methyltransferase [Patescibacteria group bacterium]MCG2698829.1 class I SAM-dependent methyltransferase [Candidatus Parcubacteria bacterium]